MGISLYPHHQFVFFCTRKTFRVRALTSVHLSAQTRLMGLVRLRHRVGRGGVGGEFRPVDVPRGRRGCEPNLPVRRHLELLLYVSAVEFQPLQDVKCWLHSGVKRRRD